LATKRDAARINPNSMSRLEVAKLLNSSRVVRARREQGLPSAQARATTEKTVTKWVEAGLPTAADGRLSLVDIAAWLACQRKDSGQGRRSAGDMAVGETKEVANLKEELLKSQIRANNASADYRLIKTELEEIKKRIHDGELLEAGEVEQGRIERAHYLREALEGLVQHAPRVHGLPLVEAREALAQIAREILHGLSDDEDEA